MRARLARMPGILETRVREETRATVKEIRAAGVENMASMVTRRSGALRRFYRASVSRGTIIVGRVGYLTARAKRKAFYARFINDGTRTMSARPFHTDAVDAAEDGTLDRLRAALRLTLSGR